MMIKTYFLANGILGELDETQSSEKWLDFLCLNGAWRGQISSDGKKIYVPETQATHTCNLLWTEDDLPIAGDYNVIIPHITKSLKHQPNLRSQIQQKLDLIESTKVDDYIIRVREAGPVFKKVICMSYKGLQLEASIGAFAAGAPILELMMKEISAQISGSKD